MKNIIIVGLLASVLILSGCTSPKMGKIETLVAKDEKKITSQFLKVNLPKPNSHVFIENTPWIPSTVTTIKPSTRWEKGNLQITMSRTFKNIPEFSGRISSLTGVKVLLAPEIISKLSSGTAASPAANTGLSSELKIHYEGSLSGLLDSVSARSGLYWEILADDSILIGKFKSQTWRISALIGSLSQINSVTNGGSNASFNVAGLSIWDSFGEGIESLLSKDGKVIISESLGTVSVTDTPWNLAKVDKYVQLQNKSLQKSILISLKIYVVELNQSENYGINWNLIYKSLNTASSAGLNASLRSSSPVIPNSTDLSLGIIGSTSELNGSTMLLKALSTRGKVSQVKDTRQLTLNGQPVPFKEGKQIAYLASSATTITDGLAKTELTPGTIETGFFLNIIPHVLDNGKNLLLQVALNMTSLDKLTLISAGGSSIQTPQTSSREMIQRVRLKSGDTLVITGFSSADLRSTLSGVGSPDNYWLGGSSGSSDAKTVMVMLVQPIVGNN